MFIASLFIITKNWKQSKCSSMGECISKQRYVPKIRTTTQQQKMSNYWYTQQHGRIPQMHHAKWKTATLKRLRTVYASIYVIFQKRQNYSDGNKTTGCHGLSDSRGRGWKKRGGQHETIFRVDLNYSVLWLWLRTHDYIFVKMHRTVHYKK